MFPNKATKKCTRPWRTLVLYYIICYSALPQPADRPKYLAAERFFIRIFLVTKSPPKLYNAIVVDWSKTRYLFYDMKYIYRAITKTKNITFKFLFQIENSKKNRKNKNNLVISEKLGKSLVYFVLLSSFEFEYQIQQLWLIMCKCFCFTH